MLSMLLYRRNNCRHEKGCSNGCGPCYPCFFTVEHNCRHEKHQATMIGSDEQKDSEPYYLQSNVSWVWFFKTKKNPTCINTWGGALCPFATFFFLRLPSGRSQLLCCTWLCTMELQRRSASDSMFILEEDWCWVSKKKKKHAMFFFGKCRTPL